MDSLAEALARTEVWDFGPIISNRYASRVEAFMNQGDEVIRKSKFVHNMKDKDHSVLSKTFERSNLIAMFCIW